MVENYWDSAYEGAKEESGGGVFGKGRVTLAYWCFVPGVSGNDREKCVFAPANGSKEARTTARKAAQKFCVDNGVQRSQARWSAVTRLYRDECVNSGGEGVTWQGDRCETVPLWTVHSDGPSAGKSVMDAVKSNGVPGATDFFGRFVWIDDPYKVAQGEEGKTRTDQDGNPAYPRVCVVAEVFPNAETCLAAAGGDEEIPFDGDEGKPSMPSQWPADTEAAWTQSVRGIIDELAELPPPLKAARITAKAAELVASEEELKDWIEYLS